MPGINDNDAIDVGLLLRRIWARRKFFYKRLWPITFVAACLYIVCIPRYYTSEAKLAPETGGQMDMGSLGSIASTFGIDLNNMQTSDAINPLLYPDLMEDNGFVASMFSIHVESADGEISTNYYDYLKTHQKRAWWSSITRWLSKAVKSVVPKKEKAQPRGADGGKKSPYWLSEDDEGIAEAVRGNVSFSINKQNAVITISTRAQDALVAKILADSVQQRLQQFITAYRTNKARIDEEHYRQMLAQAKRDYDSISVEYALRSDAHAGSLLNIYQIEIDKLREEMAARSTAVQTLQSQLQLASAKVQERTPAFTVIKGASVAQRPAGPKRMIFVVGMLVLVTMAYALWLVRKDLRAMLLPR